MLIKLRRLFLQSRQSFPFIVIFLIVQLVFFGTDWFILWFGVVVSVYMVAMAGEFVVKLLEAFNDDDDPDPDEPDEADPDEKTPGSFSFHPLQSWYYAYACLIHTHH